MPGGTLCSLGFQLSHFHPLIERRKPAQSFLMKPTSPHSLSDPGDLPVSAIHSTTHPHLVGDCDRLCWVIVDDQGCAKHSSSSTLMWRVQYTLMLFHYLFKVENEDWKLTCFSLFSDTMEGEMIQMLGPWRQELGKGEPVYFLFYSIMVVMVQLRTYS